jgi:hypothetical protein
MPFRLTTKSPLTGKGNSTVASSLLGTTPLVLLIYPCRDILKVLHKFQHPPPKQRQQAPSKWSHPQYTVKVQLTAPANTLQPLPPDDVKQLQKVVGNLLYYARAVDSTMLVALNGLASAQTKVTNATANALVHLLNYCITYPDAKIQYHASNMILHLHSDASYLSLPEARSRAGGYLFLSTKPSTKPTPNNGPILNIVKVLRNARGQRNVFCCQGQNRTFIPQLQRSHHPLKLTCRHGLSAAAHSCPNRQLNCQWHC